MPVHVVQQGECFADVARASGVDVDTLYEHPDNADLKKKRPNPNIVFPGDAIAVPDLTKKKASADTNRRHRFQIRLPKREVRLVLLDAEGQPIGGESYILESGGARVVGTTTGKGEIREALRGGARSAMLTIRGRVLVLDGSCIDPLTDVDDGGASGARERLRNLGYAVGDVTSLDDRSLRTALALFQHDQQLDVTGALDDATKSALVAAHGC